MALVKLMSAGSHSEAQLVKGLLETEGIPSVVNGESQRTDMGTEAGFAEIFILVNEEHLAQGKLLLEAKVVSETPDRPGVIAEGAVCPVHELQATAVCARCGSYLCAGCGPMTVPASCEACSARLAETPRPRTKTKMVAWLMLLFLLGIPLIGVAILRLISDYR
jgi:hypothetical protein